jgi:hypothetical protein
MTPLSHLHAYEMAAQVIDVVLNGALAVSSDKPSMAPNFFRSATSHSCCACIDHLTPRYASQTCCPSGSIFWLANRDICNFLST